MKSLVISIDTEIDADSDWRISDPPAFSSVTHGVPRVLTPLFNRYGAKPTYLLSPEIIDNEECVRTLSELGPDAELGSHMHADFIEPERSLHPHDMAGKHHYALQNQYAPEVEKEKLQNLTAAFERAFGRRPASHRAGRYGRSEHTLGFLAELGYIVDSSVTPGLRWDLPEGNLDYRRSPPVPLWVETRAGAILDLPISIRPGSWLAPFCRDYAPLRILSPILGYRTRFEWLRPGYSSGDRMVRFAAETESEILVLMMHSVEVIPGASPLAPTHDAVFEILKSLETLLAHCKESGIQFCTMSEVAEAVPKCRLK